jgi:hypothetical protein
MGVVYEGEDLRLGRRVALKFLPDSAALNPAALERFRREARAASSLDHPNICVVHDIDEHGGRPFIVMEKLEGESLECWIARETIPVPRLLEIAIQIAEALEVAHRKRILHRDVKAANVFVTVDGRAKVLDFGLAKLLTDRGESTAEEGSPIAQAEASMPRELAVTSTGMALGTDAYMSPEQARGEPLDARSDLFSLGVLLFEMATGRRPFEGAGNADVRQAILTATPMSASQLRADVPPAVARVILKLLEKDKARRHPSARDLIDDLRAVHSASAHSRSPVTKALMRGASMAAVLWMVAFGYRRWVDHERWVKRQQLLDAARSDNGEEIARLLEAGLSANEAVDHQGNAACHVAAEYGMYRSLRLLLRQGCDPSRKNIHGDDAFTIAAARQPGNQQVRLLLDEWRHHHLRPVSTEQIGRSISHDSIP